MTDDRLERVREILDAGHKLPDGRQEAHTFLMAGPQTFCIRCYVNLPAAEVATILRLRKTCPECGRVFDLTDETDADEFAYGHDCEVQS